MIRRGASRRGLPKLAVPGRHILIELADDRPPTRIKALNGPQKNYLFQNKEL